jgi:hypothetical protein
MLFLPNSPTLIPTTSDCTERSNKRQSKMTDRKALKPNGKG